MKLIMTGGGESEHFFDIDSKFISLIQDRPSLLYVPLAQDKSLWPSGHNRINNVFSTIEFENIELCKDLDSLTWETLRRFGAIYFDGGNTFELMAAIRNNHTYELLHRFLHHGGVINGDSAGAIILGSHLETAHMGSDGDENCSGLVSYQGLNLLGQYAIHAHYDRNDDKELKKFSNEFGFPIICLHEETAVFINNMQLYVIGNREAYIIKQSDKISILPGESRKL